MRPVHHSRVRTARFLVLAAAAISVFSATRVGTAQECQGPAGSCWKLLDDTFLDNDIYSTNTGGVGIGTGTTWTPFYVFEVYGANTMRQTRTFSANPGGLPQATLVLDAKLTGLPASHQLGNAFGPAILFSMQDADTYTPPILGQNTNMPFGKNVGRMGVLWDGNSPAGNPNGKFVFYITSATGENLRFQISETGVEAVGIALKSTYADLAEWVALKGAAAPGTVVAVSTGGIDEVTPTREAYDTRVAGVVSSQPGIILGIEGEGKVTVATTGRVKVKCDARKSPIRIGDLLVTSDREGYAMRSEPIDVVGVKMHRPGTLLGKALEPLEKGEGEVLVLLSLQ